jgi:hypothetical protein
LLLSPILQKKCDEVRFCDSSSSCLVPRIVCCRLSQHLTLEKHARIQGSAHTHTHKRQNNCILSLFTFVDSSSVPSILILHIHVSLYICRFNIAFVVVPPLILFWVLHRRASLFSVHLVSKHPRMGLAAAAGHASQHTRDALGTGRCTPFSPFPSLLSSFC